MGRPKIDSLDLPWKGGDPCPCSSGKKYKECCLHHDGLPLYRMPILTPPGPVTGISNPKCYMRDTSNCSSKLSREHYISRSILTQFEKLSVSGVPWQSANAHKEYGIEALTAKVLCERHNHALSPLDTAAGHGFRQLTEAMSYATKKSLARRTAFYLVSGDALELWGIKTLMGLYTSKVARAKGVTLANEYMIDFDAASRALSGRGLNTPLGMYVHSSGSATNEPFGLTTLSSQQEKEVAGIRIQMWGLHINFFVSNRGGNPEYFEKRQLYRPWLIDLDGPKRTSRVVLTWASERKEAIRAGIKIGKL